MTEWKNKRNEEISEHILTTQIVFLFMFFMAVISLSRTDFYNNLSLNWQNIYLVLLLWISFASGIVLYAGKKRASGFMLGDRPTAWDFSLFLVVFFLSEVILLFTGQSNSPVKIVFLIPVIISSTSYGKKFGLATAGAASTLLFYFDFTSGFESTPSVKFQTDIINSTVMFTLAWLIGGLADIEKAAREDLTNLANTDGLTGLSNHRHFQESLRQHFQSALENNSPLSLIILDIDYFKFYNDSYGHLKGDEVLKQVGAILSESVKQPNCAARYGGDEFMIIVPDCEERALEIAEQARTAIESSYFEGMEVQPGGKITVSVGVAAFPKHGATPKELIRSADEALYKAKHGRNRVQLYFSVMDDLREGIAESEKDLFNSIKTLVSIINAKDRYTFGHSERVAHYSLRLAERLNLPREEIVLLRYASFLHDVGKIEIDRDLLNKAGPLKPKEWATLQKHPLWGSDIIRPISSLKKAIPVILHHHENYDGTGYPGGLAGEDIPLLARILRIADSYDAMTTDRPYKKAKPPGEACNELKRCAGTLFDPALVNIFVGVVLEDESERPAFKGSTINP